jgi:hypothetical protein
MLFLVMHFPHNRSIVNINNIASDNHHPNLNFSQTTSLCIRSIRVESTLPWVHYVASYPWDSIVSEKMSLNSRFPSQYKDLEIDQVIYLMGNGFPCFPLLAQETLIFLLILISLFKGPQSLVFVSLC